MAVNGRVSALLELGAGFNPEFSGRDNVYLNGSILGLTTRQIDQRYRDIEAFAEIGEFINQPVKTYSSGMVVRLAFAVAINVDPEILLVDEALAVGDIYFRQRCMRKVHELRSRGITILFVSHAVSDVKAIGDRALWLDHGRMVEIGEPDRRHLPIPGRHGGKGFALPAAQGPRARTRGRHGDRCARPRSSRPSPTSTTATATAAPRSSASRVLDEQGEPLHHARTRASRIVVRISVRAERTRGACPSWASCCATSWAWIFRAPIPPAKATGCRRCRPATSARWISTSTCRSCIRPRSLFRRPSPTATLTGYTDVRLDRQCHRVADGARRERDLRLPPPAVPRGSERPPGRTGPAPSVENQLG